MAKQRKYAQDGVNVVEGDSFSSFAGGLCRQTYRNSPFVEVGDLSRGHFRGPRGFRLKGLPSDCWLAAAPDGDGTKVVLTDAAGDYNNAARGFVAMTAGDITRWGGIPLIITNILDTATIGEYSDKVNDAFRAMMTGLYTVCCEQNFVMLNGETAELPGCVTSPNSAALAKYLWSGVAIGAFNPKNIITGDQVSAGMSVMALRERGFRNNGVSSVRKALAMRYGDNYYANPKARAAIKAAAEPAILYDKFLANANGWFNISGIPIIHMYLCVHLTGGALKSKFFDDILAPRGLSANLDNLWQPPKIMRQCAMWRQMTDDECYETWNGGQGFLVVIDSRDERRFVRLAESFGVEARRAGKIIKRHTPSMTIKSRFTGKTIRFHAE